MEDNLEKDIALAIGRVPETDDFSEIIIEKENALKDLELETAKLEKKNKTLSKNIMELQKKISRGFKSAGPDSETLKKKIAEFKVKLQKSTESCAQQEKEIAKMESDYQSVFQLCEDQAHYIKLNAVSPTLHKLYSGMKNYGKDILHARSKAQNDSSQAVKPGATLVETIQSNMEKNIVKKQKRKFLVRHFRYLFFMIMIFVRLLGYIFFHVQYINPDFLVDTLPLLMSRSTLKWLRDILFPFLTLETEDVLPH
ncbi:transmembrane and coiled-coil domain-containing protein 5B isoform X1 [Sigmodon hispidus]